MHTPRIPSFPRARAAPVNMMRCHSQNYVNKEDFADMMKVTNWLILIEQGIVRVGLT